ncbi:MAG: hypothetical protein IPP88_16550 [Betaproteobacteria bacterium]|nr:hypothetical protein [Betaproteobacteria bacterium]
MLETARFHTSQTFTRGLSTLTRMDVGRIGSLATLPVLAAIRAQYGVGLHSAQQSERTEQTTIIFSATDNRGLSSSNPKGDTKSSPTKRSEDLVAAQVISATLPQPIREPPAFRRTNAPAQRHAMVFVRSCFSPEVFRVNV